MISLLSDERRVADAALGEARSQLEKAIALLDSSDPDQPGIEVVVHQVRKRIKKSRALIKLLRGSVGKKSVGKVDDQLQRASRPLSSVRDASALLVALDRLETRSVGLISFEPFQMVRVILEDRRAEIHWVILKEEEALVQVSKLLGSALRRMSRWEPDDHRSGPSVGIDRAYRRGREAFRNATAEPLSDPLHDLRKRVKALGYQLKVVEDTTPSKSGIRARLLCRLLAKELGEGHDLDLLRESLPSETAVEPVVKALDRRRIDLRQGSIQRARVIFQTKPKLFLRSLIMEPEAHSISARHLQQ